MYRNSAKVLRNGAALTRAELTTLAEHARITLVVERTDSDFSLGDSHENDVHRVVWSNAPWLVYRGIAADPRLSDDARDVLSFMKFTIRKPEGGTSEICLAELAAQRGTSVPAATAALIELESAGLLCWLADQQLVELASRPGEFTEV
jgi:hypothetical protein